MLLKGRRLLVSFDDQAFRRFRQTRHRIFFDGLRKSGTVPPVVHHHLGGHQVQTLQNYSVDGFIVSYFFFSRDSSGRSCRRKIISNKILIKLPGTSHYDLLVRIWKFPRNAGVMEIAPVMGFKKLWHVLCVRVVG